MKSDWLKKRPIILPVFLYSASDRALSKVGRQEGRVP